MPDWARRGQTGQNCFDQHGSRCANNRPTGQTADRVRTGTGGRRTNENGGAIAIGHPLGARTRRPFRGDKASSGRLRMAEESGLRYPPFGVPIEPQPDRPYVALKDAARRLHLGRPTLQAKVVSGGSRDGHAQVQKGCAGMSLRTRWRGTPDRTRLWRPPSCVARWRSCEQNWRRSAEPSNRWLICARRSSH